MSKSDKKITTGDLFPKTSLLDIVKLFLPLIFIAAFMIGLDKAQTDRQKLIVFAIAFVLFAIYFVYNNFKKAASMLKQMYEDESEEF